MGVRQPENRGSSRLAVANRRDASDPVDLAGLVSSGSKAEIRANRPRLPLELGVIDSRPAGQAVTGPISSMGMRRRRHYGASPPYS